MVRRGPGKGATYRSRTDAVTIVVGELLRRFGRRLAHRGRGRPEIGKVKVGSFGEAAHLANDRLGVDWLLDGACKMARGRGVRAGLLETGKILGEAAGTRDLFTIFAVDDRVAFLDDWTHFVCDSAIWHNDNALLEDDGLHYAHQDAAWIRVLHHQLLLVRTEVGDLRCIARASSVEWSVGGQGDHLLGRRIGRQQRLQRWVRIRGRG